MNGTWKWPVVLLAACASLIVSPARGQDRTAGTGSAQAQVDLQCVAQGTASPVDWLAAKDAIEALGKTGGQEAEGILVQILQRDAPLRLKEGAPLPDVMPPLQMLQASAIRALAHLKARDIAPQIRLIRDRTEFPILRRIASDALAALGDPP